MDKTRFLRRLVFLVAVVCSVTAHADDEKRYLIIHADDAGMSHSVNKGTIEAMENGTVSSASIMVPCPWLEEFAKYCRKNPDGDYGIHLTLNSEWENYRWGPVASADQVPSLIDEAGYLWDNVAQVMANVKCEEAVIELRAQIDRALEIGIPLSHLDTHMGAVLSRPDLLEAYVQLGIEYDLPILFVDAQSPVAEQYPALKEQGLKLQKRLQAKGLPVLDLVGQFYGGETQQERVETYRGFLGSIPPGVSLLIVHCGYDDDELRSITNSASRRDGDRQIFTNPAMTAFMKDANIEIITWNQFRRMRAK